MATDLGETTGTIRKQERTWRTEIESPLGAVPSVVAHRETVRSVGDEVLSQTPGITVRRSFDKLVASNDSVTVNGETYTAAEIAAVIPAFIDKWREEDLLQVDPQPNPEIP